MELVGYSDLQGRSAYQPLVRKQGSRWIAYIGHHGDHLLNPLSGRQEDSGTSILDVTDPKQPKYLSHIPGEPGKAEAGGAQMGEAVVIAPAVVVKIAAIGRDVFLDEFF